jgi:pantoate--beta-alanine ligase
MRIVRTAAEVRAALFSKRHLSIALVPTMGALHRGHEALFRAARMHADMVVATIFVNPAQFGDPRDLQAYPRDEAADAGIAEAAGVDLLFAPAADTIYPAGYATWVDVEGAAMGFEGAYRPGHFRGVATICLKFFNIVSPTIACFGQKDAQQAAVIEQIVRDLDLPMDIRIVATERDTDGLALSSRNARLSASERLRAIAIPRALAAGLDAYRQGLDPVQAARARLGDLNVDYVEVATLGGQSTLVIAARVGATRLIDNMPLDTPERGGARQLADALAGTSV